MIYRRKYLSILIFLGSIMELKLPNYFVDLTVPLDYSGSWYVSTSIMSITKCLHLIGS